MAMTLAELKEAHKFLTERIHPKVFGDVGHDVMRQVDALITRVEEVVQEMQRHCEPSKDQRAVMENAGACRTALPRWIRILEGKEQ